MDNPNDDNYLKLSQKVTKLCKFITYNCMNMDFLKDFLLNISNILESNIILLDDEGNLLYENIINSLIIDTKDNKRNSLKLDGQVINKLNNIVDIKINILFKSLGTENEFDNYKCCVIPVLAVDRKLATLIFYKKTERFTKDIDILCEYIMSILTIILAEIKKNKYIEEKRNIEIAKASTSTLSYSELEAIINIFAELEDKREGILIASKIADRAGITRSVIVNALRKFESAGLLESRSLGMKGTYIKIINEHIITEINKFKR